MWQSILNFLAGLFQRNERLENRADFDSVTREWRELVQELRQEVTDLRHEVQELRERIAAEEERTRDCEEGRLQDAVLIGELKSRIEHLERKP